MKILVIGDAMADQYVYGCINRMSPEDSTVPVVDMNGDQEMRLGGCLNVALNLKALGAEVSVSSILGTQMYSALEDAGIRTPLSVIGGTIVKKRIINLKTGKQVARLDYGKRFSEADIVYYKRHVHVRMLNEFDAIVVSDYQKGVVDEYWASRLPAFDRPIFIDTKNPTLSLWSKAPNVFFKLNELEFLCADHKNNDHPVIVTRGSQDTELHQIDDMFGPTVFNTKPVSNPDVVGAGDVFVSALAVEYLRTNDMALAIEFANNAAAYSCTKQGTVAVTREEVEQWITTRK